MDKLIGGDGGEDYRYLSSIDFLPDVLLSEYGRTWDKKSAVKFKTLLVIVRLNQSDHIGTWRS